MLQRHFSIFNPHLEGSRVQLSTNQHNIATFGSDDIIFQVDNLQGLSTSLEVRNQEKLQITAFAMNPKQANCFVFGTSSGVVRYLRPIHQLQLHKAQILFIGTKSIKSVCFSNSAKFLGIACEQQPPIIYCTKSRKLMRLPKQHEGFVNSVSFCEQNFVFSIGTEGKLLLFSVTSPSTSLQEKDEDASDNPFDDEAEEVAFTLIDSYKIAAEGTVKRFPFLNAAYAQFQQQQNRAEIILASGQHFLQIIQLSNRQSQYNLQKKISEQSQILQVQPLGTGKDGKGITLVTSTEQFLSIWNYTKKQKIVAVDIREQVKAVVSTLQIYEWKKTPSFAFLTSNRQSDGRLYVFNSHELLNIDSTAPEQEGGAGQLIEEQKLERAEEEREVFISVKDKLLGQYPQFPLQRGYEQFQKARFLFYNSVGCVIERFDDEGNSTLELQLHDKSKPKRFQIDLKSRSFGLFALKEKAFLCATMNLILFQEDKLIKNGSEGWEIQWEKIQGVSIGVSWVAAINTEEIRIFDYAGNELHSISFDRRFITMEAYEDMLVVVYHSTLPMWGCQSIKMRIYKITTFSVKVERDVNVPIRPNSILKWFGFSEEGMLLCQDSLEVVRCYSFKRDEWQVVFSLEGKQERLFIQHVQGSDIFGFRLQHGENEREEPKVLPRSLARKICMELVSEPIECFSHDETNYLRKIKLRNLLLEHQEFRHQSWYKLKYSRKKEHVWFEQSKTIKSFEEIKTFKLQSDLQLHDYLKKYLDRTSFPVDKALKWLTSLVIVCERETHFEDTRDKLRQLLSSSNGRSILMLKYLPDMLFRPMVEAPRCKQKLKEVSILEQMLNLMTYV